jgi:hypothetical protein
VGGLQYGTQWHTVITGLCNSMLLVIIDLSFGAHPYRTPRTKLAHLNGRYPYWGGRYELNEIELVDHDRPSLGLPSLGSQSAEFTRGVLVGLRGCRAHSHGTEIE